MRKNLLKYFFLVVFAATVTQICADEYDIGLKAFIGKQYDQALQIWEPAARQGDTRCQIALGFMYAHGIGVEKDLEKAKNLYTPAANQDNAEAQFYMGYIATQLNTPDKAVFWYRKAASNNYEKAFLGLGLLFYDGQAGVKKDLKKAFYWFKQAAAKNIPEAQLTTGLMLFNGQGVEKSYTQAAKWFEQAAAANNTTAQFNLGYMYAAGLGIKKNNTYAYMWLKLAAQKGNENAKLALKELQLKMYPDKVKQATQMAKLQKEAIDFVKFLTNKN